MKLFPILISCLFGVSVVLAQEPNGVVLSDSDNQEQNISALAGEKLTVIDFWATWCKPCLLAMPKLSQLHQQFADKGVQFVGISTDGPRNQSKVRPLVNTLGLAYPILLDSDQELAALYNVTAMPTLLIFDADWQLVYTHEGFKNGDEQEIEAAIQKWLDK